jgi:hypothetical protein
MFGKLAGIAIVASLALTAAPSALGAPRVGIYDSRTDLSSGLSADVAQAIEASGFARTPPPSAGLLPRDASFSWGDAGVGVGIGAGVMLLALGGTRRGPRPT